RALAGADALIVRSETRVTADLLTRAPRLRVIARAGTGVDSIDVPAATRRGIAVMNAPGANTVSAAEHAMGLLLGLVRHIPWAAEAMRRGEWDRKRFEGTELRGKTIGVVGMGRIGGHVGQLARAFGMQVVGHDPYLAPERAAELQVKLLPLDQLLRQADVVTLYVAHTEQTHHLINAERLALMKPTAVLVNTARGELVDEAALADAVRARRLGRLPLALVDGPVQAVEVAYGGKDEAAPRPVLVAAVEGLLSAMNVMPVSLVNALLIAEERGIQHARKTGMPEPGFETTVGVKLATANTRVRVAGALVGNSHGRVVRIDDYHVDVAPEGWMLVIRNRDVPGVIGRVGTLLGQAGINIGSYHQARRATPGTDALAAITVDQALTNGVLEHLGHAPDVLDVRLVHFGD